MIMSGYGLQTRPRALAILAKMIYLHRYRSGTTDSSTPMPRFGKCARMVSAT